jgi:hypothetical protein
MSPGAPPPRRVSEKDWALLAKIDRAIERGSTGGFQDGAALAGVEV